MKIKALVTKILASIAALTLMALPCAALSPTENGSSAQQLVDNVMQNTTEESDAMPQLLTITIGGGVVAAAIITVAVILNQKSDDKDDNLE